jgi:hypothetical protein
MIRGKPFEPIEFLDSTGVQDFRACPARFYWRYARRLAPRAPNVHLIAGGAFAAGLAEYRRTGSEELGLKALLAAYTLDTVDERHRAKALDRVVTAYAAYLDQYGNVPVPLRLADGTPTIEVSFTLELPLNWSDGTPMLYSGRIDLIGEHPELGVVVVDEKTCRSFERDTSSWELRGQFWGYAWAARQLGFDPKWILVRRVALQVTAIDFSTVIIGVTDWRIGRWFEELCFTARQLRDAVERNVWSQNLGDACSSYGGCPFRQLCVLQEPHGWEAACGFEEQAWNPIPVGKEE